MAQKYGIYEGGRFTAFYADDVHSVIPQGAVPIDDETWQDELSNPGKYRVSVGEDSAQCLRGSAR